VREGGNVLVRGPHGREGDAVIGNLAAVAALRGALGLDAAGPAPGASR